MKEECAKLKTNLVNLSISIIFDLRLSTQWKRNTSLSHSWMCICKKAFSIFPQRNIGLNLNLVRISQIKFCNGGPVSRHSFNDTYFLLRQYKLLSTFVVRAASLTTALLFVLLLSLLLCCSCCFSHYCFVCHIKFVILALRFLIYFFYYSILLLISCYVIICIELIITFQIV